MEPLTEAKILLIAAGMGPHERWARLLRESGALVWTSAEAVPPDVDPHVIVTCSPGTFDSDAAVLWIGQTPVDQPGPTEVFLPKDASDRELLLACRLLTRIVQLQRRLDAGDRTCRRLSEEALTDPLTRLPNRRAWDGELQQRLQSVETTGPLGVALFDLDLFKRINDAQGHAIGDEVLRATGRSLRDSLRRDDFVARLGGDEFGLLVAIPDAETAKRVIERARVAIPSATAGHGVTASAGFYAVNSSTSAQQVYSEVSTALREAKRLGRDQTVAAM